jgi:hypothetical protein
MTRLEAGVDQHLPDIRKIDLLSTKEVDTLTSSDLRVQAIYKVVS